MQVNKVSQVSNSTKAADVPVLTLRFFNSIYCNVKKISRPFSLQHYYMYLRLMSTPWENFL